MGTSFGCGLGRVAIGPGPRASCSVCCKARTGSGPGRPPVDLFEASSSVAKAVPALCDNAATAPSVPPEASSLPNDPCVAGLLEKVAELKQRMSARRSLGGILADQAAKRAGSKHRGRVGDSRRRKRRRGSDVSSDHVQWF